MAKKCNNQKRQKKHVSINPENRYPRAIALAIIAFLALFMPKTLAVRLLSMLLIALDVSKKKIAVILNCSEKTVKNLSKRMEDEEVCTILTIKKGSGRKSKVDSSIQKQIVDTVNKGTFYSLRQIADMVLANFKFCLSTSTISRILKSFNIRKLKCGSLPAKADFAKQRKFYEDTLHPLMEKSKKGLINLLFMDGAHFVMGMDFLGGIYSVLRRFKITFNGRKRYNVLGAIDFRTKVFHKFCNDKYLNAKVVCRFLVRIWKAYKNTNIQTKVIIDNAAYQKCNMVTLVAKKLNIELVPLPSYSPNLNLIERFWKFAKGILRTKSYQNFDIFCKTIDDILDSSSTTNKKAVEKLIDEKVQLFDDLIQVTEEQFEQPKKKRNKKKAA